MAMAPTHPSKESQVSKIEKVLFSGNSHATINRDPTVERGPFGVLDLELSASGGESREFIATGLHPRAEQLFRARGRPVTSAHSRLRQS